MQYTFIQNPLKTENTRLPYFQLVKEVFGLDFTRWYNSGLSGGDFIPYTLFDNGKAIATVGVLTNHFVHQGQRKAHLQISTVATHKDYRNQGLSKWLLQAVLADHQGHDIYLYANDSVKNFYPKFGFIQAHEYSYSLPIQKNNTPYTKLDLSKQQDLSLLLEKFNQGNPFSALFMDKNFGIMMFHTLNFLGECIYLVDDAIVIAEEDKGALICYDIYTATPSSIQALLGAIAPTDITATLGFTPKDPTGYTIEPSHEDNTTIFVLPSNENIFTQNKITIPYLSRA